jgi:hypothetical protein
VLECRSWLVPLHVVPPYFVLSEPEPSESRRSSQVDSGLREVSVAMRIEKVQPAGRRNGAHGELELLDEAPAEERAAERRAARIKLRMYCVMCGRSETVLRAQAHPGRCPSCDGTLLTELEPD